MEYTEAVVRYLEERVTRADEIANKARAVVSEAATILRADREETLAALATRRMEERDVARLRVIEMEHPNPFDTEGDTESPEEAHEGSPMTDAGTAEV